MEATRLNKLLSEIGVCSRREADRMIEAGKVTVDGKIASAGMKVTADQVIVFDGKPVGSASGSRRPKPVLLAVHKPRGVVCTTSSKDRAPTIVEMVNYPARVYPIGRLDKDSEGLIFMTNQGDLVNRIMRGSNGHEKEYEVKVNKPITAEFIEKMAAGVWLKELNVQTKPCRMIARAGEREFRIILTQGLNRQIRRMCGELGYQVQTLKRVRIMNVRLGNLKEGTFRKVSEEEYTRLLEMLDESSPADRVNDIMEQDTGNHLKENKLQKNRPRMSGKRKIMRG